MTKIVEKSNGVLSFAMLFWRPHIFIMSISGLLMLFSTSLNIAVPQVAKEIATFDSTTQEENNIWNLSSSFIPAPPGLVTRCAFLSAIIILYHTSSFMAHRTAHLAGQKVHNTILESTLIAILRTPHLDRIAPVNPVKLSQVILSSAKTSAEVVGALLTDVLSSVCAAVALLAMLLYMSMKLTISIGTVLVVSQLILRGVRRHQHNRNKELALAESNVQALTTNALHRSMTVRVFHAESLIENNLKDHLRQLSMIHTDVVTALHGHTAFSSAVTGLLFVVVLGMTNYYRQRGELDMVDIAMYYLFLFQFISRVLGLQHEFQRMFSLLEGLHTLQQMISWYEVEPLLREYLISPESVLSKMETVSKLSVDIKIPEKNSFNEQENENPILLENVTYAYPEIPPFLFSSIEEGKKNGVEWNIDENKSTTSSNTNFSRIGGVHDITFKIQTGKITVLYGPSGSGKSTCLRILAGILSPQDGMVRTHSKVALLEQQQAVLMGNVADNILMTDSNTFSKDQAEKARQTVNIAMKQSGCHTFLKDPFQTVIHSPDKTQFSGGQLQRICMARLFARRECTLLLLDEPTTGLDASNVEHMLSTLSELNRVYKKTIVIATHDTRISSIADEIIDFEQKKNV